LLRFVALRRLQLAAPMTVWQPIDTAPRDGTDVLVWAAGKYGRRLICIANYDMGQWWTDASECHDANRYFPPECYPTYWMPLPEPPEDK
jgi:Protein of unknown function (DUF551)